MQVIFNLASSRFGVVKEVVIVDCDGDSSVQGGDQDAADDSECKFYFYLGDAFDKSFDRPSRAGRAWVQTFLCVRRPGI